jgi:hypothetical protein
MDNYFTVCQFQNISYLKSRILYLPMYRSHALAAPLWLSLLEGLAVGALVNSGVGLVGADHDSIQGAVVLTLTVMGTLGNGAFDALVSVAVHTHFLLCFGIESSMPPKIEFIH